MMLELSRLSSELRESGVILPAAYQRVFELGLTNISPWRFLDSDEASNILSGMRELYPNHVLLPFARRDDCDDGAAFVISSRTLPLNAIVVVHLFADEAFAFDETFAAFWDWFRSAVNEMIEMSP